jgi:hypothetical protein
MVAATGIKNNWCNSKKTRTLEGRDTAYIFVSTVKDETSRLDPSVVVDIRLSMMICGAAVQELQDWWGGATPPDVPVNLHVDAKTI